MNKTAKNTSIYFVGTVVMGVLGLVNTMLLTRLIEDPKVYAMYGLLHQFITTAAMFISFGFDAAYARFYYKHNQTQHGYLLKVLLIPGALFALFALAVIEPSQWIVRSIFGSELSAIVILLLLLYLFFTFVHRFTQLTARMEEHALNYVLSNFIGRFGFIFVIAAVFFVWKSVSFDWVLISSLIASILATILNLWIFLKAKKDKREDGSLIGQKEMLSYGVPIMINNVLILVVPLLEKIIIREAAVNEEAGWEMLSVYTAVAVFQTVVMLLVNTIDNIWNPIVFKNCDKPQKFKPIMHNFGLAVSVIVIVGFSLCVLLRRWLVLLLGAEYRGGVMILAPAICFGTCFRLVTMIYSAGIHIEKKTIHFIVEPIIQLGLSLILCFSLLRPLGLVGVGIAVTVSVIASRIYRMAVGLYLYDTGVSEYKVWVLMGVCTAVAFASLFFTSFIADVVMFVVLIAAMLLILNKDLLTVIQTAKTLMIPSKKSEKN